MSAKPNKAGKLIMTGQFVTAVTVRDLRKIEETLRLISLGTPHLTFEQALKMLAGKARIVGDNVVGYALEEDE